MDKVNVDKVVTILCALLFMLAEASLFTSCEQVRYVATSNQHRELEKSVVHDTLYVTRVVRGRVVEKEKDSTTVVVDDKGQEKSRDRIRDRFIFIENQDSVNFYRAIADSLLTIVTDSIENPVVVERELSRWERTKMKIGGIFVEVIGIVCLTVVVAWYVRRRGKQKGGV